MCILVLGIAIICSSSIAADNSTLYDDTTELYRTDDVTEMYSSNITSTYYMQTTEMDLSDYGT